MVVMFTTVQYVCLLCDCGAVILTAICHVRIPNKRDSFVFCVNKNLPTPTKYHRDSATAMNFLSKALHSFFSQEHGKIRT